MRSLRRIQILCKIGKIICLVLFILAIIGAAGCLISIPALALGKGLSESIRIEGKTFEEYIAEQGMSMPALYVALAVGLFFCGVGIFLAKYNQLFYERELKDGTPFTRDFVKYMRKVALVNIIVSASAGIIVAIALAICKLTIDLSGLKNDGFSWSTLGYGISLLILSIFVEYPVEAQEVKQVKEENTLPKDDYLE